MKFASISHTKVTDLETHLSGLMFDVSEANGGESFATLSDALTRADSILLVSQKKGGMTIKYIQSSDNKYVQYRLVADSWTTNTKYWQDISLYETISLLDSNIWEKGKIDATSGKIDPSVNDRLASKMLPFKREELLAVASKTSGISFTTTVYCYDKYGTYLGYKSGTTSITNAVSDYPNAYLFRLGLIDVTGVSPIEPSNINNIITTWREPFIYKFLFTTLYDGVTKDYVNETALEKIHDSLIYQVDFTQKDNWVDGGTDTTTGIIDPSRTDRLSSKLIPFAPVNITLTPKTGVSFQVNVYCYDYKQDYLGLLLNNSSIIDAYASYPNAVYFRIGLISISGVSPISADNISNIISAGITYAWKYTISKGFDDIIIKHIDNKIEETIDLYVNLNDSTNWVDGGTDTTTGIIVPSRTDRLSTKMFQFNKDVVFSCIKPSGVSWQNNIYCYDKFKAYIGYVQFSWSIENVLELYPNAVYFRIGLISISGVSPISADNVNNIAIFKKEYPIHKYVTSPEFQALENSDKLYGKLWYACGDSFTEGVDNSPLPNGKYAGKKQVYPYFIGNRTGMEVMNIAVSGSTITYINGTSTQSNCFTYPSTGKLYAIPTNAEYITLKFGINDSHQNVPIGTIDDETNTTLYGAWNVAISYLLNKCPFAKIGIIVTNGCDSPEYSQVGKDIAKKWGISYLDENFGYEVPLLHRVNGKPLVCSEAHQNRMENFRISENNTHPNNKAHEFESTFVEAWLRTL